MKTTILLTFILVAGVYQTYLKAADAPTSKERIDYCVAIVESGICKSVDSPGSVFGWFYRYAEKQDDMVTASRKITDWKSLEDFFAQLAAEKPKNVALVEKVTLAWLRSAVVAKDWNDSKANRDKLAEWRKTLFERLQFKGNIAPDQLPDEVKLP